MSGESCHLHPGVAAAARCDGCGRPVCTGCLEPGSDPPRCLACAIAEAGDVAGKVMRPPASSPPRRQRGTLSPALLTVLAVGLAVLLVEVGILVLMRPTPAPPPGDAAGPKRLATAQSAADLLVVQEAVEAYRRRHGTYPPSLEAVAEHLPPDLRTALRRHAVVYAVGPEQGYRIRYRQEGSPPLLLESERRVIVTEEVAP